METDHHPEDSVFGVSDGWNRDDRPPSIAIIETISDIERVDPLELDFNLSDVVDPEALDRLFLDRSFGDVEVTLDLKGYAVTVRNDGSLDVRMDTVS